MTSVPSVKIQCNINLTVMQENKHHFSITVRLLDLSVCKIHDSELSLVWGQAVCVFFLFWLPVIALY